MNYLVPLSIDSRVALEGLRWATCTGFWGLEPVRSLGTLTRSVSGLLMRSLDSEWLVQCEAVSVAPSIEVFRLVVRPLSQIPPTHLKPTCQDLGELLTGLVGAPLRLSLGRRVHASADWVARGVETVAVDDTLLLVTSGGQTAHVVASPQEPGAVEVARSTRYLNDPAVPTMHLTML